MDLNPGHNTKFRHQSYLFSLTYKEIFQEVVIGGRINSEKVEQNGLSNVLPLVKYELGQQREYYLGMAVDTSAVVEGSDPEEAARQS